MTAYQADASLTGKLRRRVTRLVHRRPAPRGPERPMVSFAFDDAPATAAAAGAAVLEQRGVRGTYFVCAGLDGGDGPMGRYATADDYQRLAAAGHEIGCHTFSHLDCGQASGAAAVDEAAHNCERLREWGLSCPATFAYPYGDVAPETKRALAGRYRLLRALHPGLIRAGSDLNQAPAVGVEGPGGEAVARRWLAHAKTRRAWLILYTHDVADPPSPWGCTPDALARLVDAALADGFEVVTVAEGVRRVSG